MNPESKPHVTSSAGFSPRIYPRPKYPSVLYIANQIFKAMVIQSVIVGTVLTFLFKSHYFGSLPLVSERLRQFQLWRNVGISYLDIDAAVFSVLLTVSHTIVYVVANGLFGALDYFGLLQEYKLPRKSYMTPKGGLLIKCLAEATLSQLLINPVIGYFIFPFFVQLGLQPLHAPLPSVEHIIASFAAAHLFNDIGFYTAHRCLHSKLLYKTFHKQHHDFTGTIGIAAEYANPIEQVLANMIPTLGGMIFFGGHPLCLLIWLSIRLKQTYEAHSGYCFRGTIYSGLGLSHADQAAHHDCHHSVNTGNFGVEWLDWLLGTQDGYVQIGLVDGYIARKAAMNNLQAKIKGSD